MRHHCVRAIIFGAALLAAGAAQAQQPAPPADPNDVIPDQMPFNVPYGMAISADHARDVIAAAATEAKKRGWPMNIAVVDGAGNLVAFERMDGAQLASVEISQHKARTAARFRRETKLFEKGINVGHVNSLITLDGVIASRGGIPLVEGGKLIGAIGCSGGTGSQDEVVAMAGAALIK
jgi:glc operon protein GlcG